MSLGSEDSLDKHIVATRDANALLRQQRESIKQRRNNHVDQASCYRNAFRF